MKKLLLLILGFPLLAHANFSDVDALPFGEAIEHLRKLEIISGYPDGTFRPNASINRAEFTKIIMHSRFADNSIRECDTQKYTFEDVPSQAWFAPYICIAKKQGLIEGYPNGTFDPANNILFTEAAKIIVESFSLATQRREPWYAPYVKSLSDAKAIPQSITKVDKTITRGEMAELIFRVKTNTQNKPASLFEFNATPEIEIKPRDPNVPDGSAHIEDVLDLVNEARKDLGAAPLTFNPVLQEVAQEFAQLMDDENFFDHIGPEGSTPSDRVRDAGYRYRFVGENIAKGQVTAQEVFDTWKKSPPHWGNIIKSEYKEIGIGKVQETNDPRYAGFIWVQVFGTPME